MYTPCPNENEACRFYETEMGCAANTHHTYFPRRRYTGQVEKEFRNLPENKAQMCMAEHADFHAENQPPPKPSRETMIQAIAAHAIQEVA